ncbi:MAG: membrane-bound lytic murein transglycosylase MltF [Ectothiorhodospiraceae bacterium]
MAHHVLRALIAAAGLALVAMAVSGYLRQPSLLEEIRSDGVLIVATRLGPTTLYRTDDGPAGMDYDMASRLADRLGVDLRLIVAESRTEMYQALASRRAHIAAGALSISAERRDHFRFTPRYAQVDQHLVYHRGEAFPENPGELARADEARIRVAASSQGADRLRVLADGALPDTWDIHPDATTRELLYGVWTGNLDYTIVDSNELALNQSYYPELRVAFTFNEPQQLAWAVRRDGDDSLYGEVVDFLETIREDGTLASIRERYYGYLSGFDYVGARTFLRHVTERLPRYRDMFQQAGEEYGIDWRLLAAISYQESHWEPDAVSHTGVRGLMMLTQKTAERVGVSDRLVPDQAIVGGAQFFRWMLDRLPEQITMPDRRWLALAAYNVGPGHLEDARTITETQGGNPDRWVDVRRHLPLLSDPEWYTKTRHGQARGEEPVHYVRGVRRYYALLTRITDADRFRLDPERNPQERRPFTARDAGHVRLPDVLRALY